MCDYSCFEIYRAGSYTFTVPCVTVSRVWFVGLTIAGTTMKRLDNQGILMNVFNKSSALFIWGAALYLLIELIK